MATRKKKLPELELPYHIARAVSDYVGSRTMNKLSARQRERLAEATQACATLVGRVLDGQPEDLP